MSGRFSRNKGRRTEYELRDHLRRLGYKADRVPSSGAAQGFKGDIHASKEGKTYIFEVKNYADKFNSIYVLYEAAIRSMKEDVVGFAFPFEKHVLVSLSSSLESAIEGPIVYESYKQHKLYEGHKRAFEMLGKMQRLLKESDILVIRTNRKPFLFIIYR